MSYIFPFLAQTDLSINLGSILYGLAGMLGAIISPFFIGMSCVGIRRGFIVGFALVSVCFGVLAFAESQDLDGVTLAIIMVYQVVMQSTVGPLYWYHITEIAPGIVLSLSHFWIYTLQILMSSVGPYVLDSKQKDQITFITLAVANLLSTLFCYFCLKSTQKLTSEQKKLVYVSSTD